MACGRVDERRLWEGWLQFTGPNGAALRTRRETEQPSRDALMYWAEGLTLTYLEGALERAISAQHDVTESERPVSVRAVLNPFTNA